jgi:acyl carrier protein
MTEKSRHVAAESKSSPTAAEIQQWLTTQLADELKIGPDRIRADRPILSYGIDSMQLVTIVARMEDWLGLRFSSNPLEDHPTIESLSQYVASDVIPRQHSSND